MPERYITPCPNHFREKMVLEWLLKILKNGNVPDDKFAETLSDQIHSLSGCTIHHYGKRDIFVVGKHNVLVSMVHDILKALPALPDPEMIRVLEEEINKLAIQEVQHKQITEAHSQLKLPGF